MIQKSKERSARRARGELTVEEAENIIKSKEKYDHEYRPYEFDDSFLDPGSRLPMHYPVRGRCGHVFCKEQFIHRMTYENATVSAMCPWRTYGPGKFDVNRCEVKVDLNDLVIDVHLSEEIERRKAERKKQKEAGLWPMTGLNLTGNHTGVDQKSAFRPYGYGGDKALRVCRCNECDKIYDSISDFMRHYRDEHKKTEPLLDKEEGRKSPEKPKETNSSDITRKHMRGEKWNWCSDDKFLCCSFCEPEPDFGKDHDQLKNHILADHPELKIVW